MPSQRRLKEGPYLIDTAEKEFVDGNCVVLGWLIGEHWNIFFPE